MAIFNSYVSHYQRVIAINGNEIPPGKSPYGASSKTAHLSGWFRSPSARRGCSHPKLFLMVPSNVPWFRYPKKRYEIFWDRRNRSYKLITIDLKLSNIIQHQPSVQWYLFRSNFHQPRHPSPAAVPEIMSLPHVMEMKVKWLQWWKHHYPLGIERSYGKWPIYKWCSH